MDRILFIVPPYVEFGSYVNPGYNERTVAKKSGNYGSVVTDMPIGLLSLSAYVKQYADVKTKLIDFNTVLNKLDSFAYRSFSELYREFLSSEALLEYAPTIIGISALFTTAYHNMVDVAEIGRQVFAGALIIAGGGVPTNMYREIYKDTETFDALCFGEGEKPLLGLLSADNKKEFFINHPSWITRPKIDNGISFRHEFIEDLDEIPFYDYDLLDIREYALSPTVKSYASFDDTHIIFHIATSRGCPNRCCFCASHTVHGRKMRYHSVERMREDLTRLKSQFGAVKIGVQDDHFMADKDRAYQIINILKELKMTVFFQSGLALHALDRNMLETLKDAGVNQLVLAIESGSERVLKQIMHKPLNLSIVKRVIDDCRELDLDTDANILIGLPGEKKADIEDTRAFLKTLDATWFRIYIATPLVGSEMYEICMKNGCLKGSHIGSHFKRAVVETEAFTSEYIQGKAYSLNLELNFVCNSDFRLGNYQAALKGFENTICVKPDHAFAHYFAAKCYKMLNLEEKYLEHKTTYREIIEASSFWKDYADAFGLSDRI